MMPDLNLLKRTLAQFGQPNPYLILWGKPQKVLIEDSNRLSVKMEMEVK